MASVKNQSHKYVPLYFLHTRPLLEIWCINISLSQMRLFADDSVIYREINSSYPDQILQNICQLQSDLDTLSLNIFIVHQITYS